jgi:hypothetical protein
MTPEDAKARVEKIRAKIHDDEMAHPEEDELHRDALTAIANGTAVDGAMCAREALRTSETDFARWCA